MTDCERFFNTAGPVEADTHYLLPPLDRIELASVLSLVRQRKYLVLHAPRQTGKTSTLLALCDLLNSGGHYRCVYVNVEGGQTAREDVGEAMHTVLSVLGRQAKLMLKDDFPDSVWPEVLAKHPPHDALTEMLSRWAQADSVPLVLMIDEIDALVGDALVSVLRQLRNGYTNRPKNFPQSVVLCGVRDVRDYRIHASSEKEMITGGSAFNIKAESLRLGNFSEAEANALLDQHTAATGQEFTDVARRALWESTLGQPWLVNALANETCFETETGLDRSQAVTGRAMEEAREALILRRETHLDQLTHKLREERVRRVIEPMLSGDQNSAGPTDEDIEYVQDLGLIASDAPLRMANPIYHEVVPRQLTHAVQVSITHQPSRYVGADGSLQTFKLMEAFQQFFRERSEHWTERFAYREAGPQLLLQSFLQRIVNSGGRVDREYGLGRTRTDLLIHWRLPGKADAGDAAGPCQRVVIECKILRGSLDKAVAKGVEQTRAYMDRSGAGEGHLVLFDSRSGRSWDDRVFRREADTDGAPVTIWGM